MEALAGGHNAQGIPYLLAGEPRGLPIDGHFTGADTALQELAGPLKNASSDRRLHLVGRKLFSTEGTSVGGSCHSCPSSVRASDSWAPGSSQSPCCRRSGLKRARALDRGPGAASPSPRAANRSSPCL